MGQPTLADVARKAGVSRQSAGAILAGKDALFRPAKVQAVKEAAVQLGYRPHGIGLALRSGRTDTIALIQDRNRYRTLNCPDLLAAIEERLADHGKLLAYASLSENADPPQVLQRIVADGLLISYHADPPSALGRAIAVGRTPALFLNVRRATACVYHDEHVAAKTLTEHCLKRWRTVGYVEEGPATPADRQAEPHHSIADRRDGYEQACRLAGVPPRIMRVYYGADVPAFATQVAAMLAAPDRPRCLIFATNQDKAAAAQIVAMAAGLRIPDDLALASFAIRRNDDLPWAMPLAIQCWDAMGATAVDHLLAAINAPRTRIPAVAIPMHLLAETRP